METLITTEEKQAQPIAKKSLGASFIFAVILFLAVLLGTVGLKVYTYALDKKLEGITNQISETENTITQTKQKNPEVNAYSLWSKSKDSIESQITRSQAQKFLVQLDSIARAFYRKVSFSGFNYADGKIETNAVAFGSSTDAAINIIELLRNYRGEPKTPDTLFSLEPVLSVNGDATRREFSITFNIKKDASFAPVANQNSALPSATPISNTGSTLPTSTGTIR